jgi:hypothetical protein
MVPVSSKFLSFRRRVSSARGGVSLSPARSQATQASGPMVALGCVLGFALVALFHAAWFAFPVAFVGVPLRRAGTTRRSVAPNAAAGSNEGAGGGSTRNARNAGSLPARWAVRLAATQARSVSLGRKVHNPRRGTSSSTHKACSGVASE